MCFGDWCRDDFITNAELVEFLLSVDNMDDIDSVEFVDDEIFGF